VYSRVLWTPFGSCDPNLKERNLRSDGEGTEPMLKKWRDRRKVNELARLLAALDALAEAR
jgi:hypothetical protein